MPTLNNNATFIIAKDSSISFGDTAYDKRVLPGKTPKNWFRLLDRHKEYRIDVPVSFTWSINGQQTTHTTNSVLTVTSTNPLY